MSGLNDSGRPGWHSEPLPGVADIVVTKSEKAKRVLGGSWDLVSKVISTLRGVISNYKYSYLSYNPSY